MDVHEAPSPIQNYYANTTVFITGGTGFLGKLILEKLLRSCTTITKIYLLIREKKGKNPEKRLEEIFDNMLFDHIRKVNKQFTNKIVLLNGDCALPDLGLSDTDKQILFNEVHCIFHCAATVRFDEKLRTAVHINIRATRDLLNLAKQIKHLRSLVYVSTAFSHCYRKDINEEFYQPTITGEQLIALVDNLSDDILSNVTPILLGNWPNTYALTKAIAEEIIQSHGQDLPVAVIRPAIVIATSCEPLAGWIDNLYGATGVLVGISLGLIRTLHCKVDCSAEVVPADFVINCAISAAWQVGVTSKHSTFQKLGLNAPDVLIESFHTNDDINQSGYKIQSNGVNSVHDSEKIQESESDIVIYNYVSSPQNRITWRSFMQYAEKHLLNIPSPLMVWYCCFILDPYHYTHVLCVFLFHTIPAYVVDFIARCIGKEPILVKGYQKINKFLNVLAYFSSRDWQFQNHNTQALWKKLNAEDKKLFNFDITSLDYDAYFHDYAIGGRVYLLKDPLDTIPKGKVKYRRLKIAHYAVVFILLAVLYKLLSMLWNITF